MAKNNLQILTSSYSGPLPVTTLVDAFEGHCSRHPEKVLYYYLEDGIQPSTQITYLEMRLKARALAARLQKGFEKGDRVLLLFPPGIEFITSLFGCFYAGLVGIPSYPPRKNRMFDRFEAIIVDSSPSVIMTTKKIHEDILKNFGEKESLTAIDYVIVEDVKDEWAESWKDPGLQKEDIALLQYTSGSTGSPNGVMISHQNIIHNSEVIRQAFGHTEELMGVNWLPGFHDMGLIGALLQPAYVGGSNAMIPPATFLTQPMNWLKAISNFRGSTAGGPNFALEYCVERFQEDKLEGVDLGSVRPFFCGAEPIYAESLELFAEHFARYNFSRSQFYACYGLAEATLFVTGGSLEDDPIYLTLDGSEIKQRKVLVVDDDHAEAKTFVGCGYPWVGAKVVIADPEKNEVLPEGHIGEIWTASPSVAKGYWNKPGKSQGTFQTKLADTGEGPFLRTGDLGFIHKGQLFITGRIKDVIIIRGMNHYPNDIERTVENAHESIQPATGAAFSVEVGNEERLVVVFEVRRTHMRDLDEKAVFDAIRIAVAEVHLLDLYAIVLIRPGSIPKTSSGKIQRFKAREEFLEGSLQIVASREATGSGNLATGDEPDSDNEVIHWIKKWMAKELKLDISSIRSDKPITVYGLDSLKAVILVNDASEHFGVELPLDIFLEETTIEKIAGRAMEIIKAGN